MTNLLSSLLSFISALLIASLVVVATNRVNHLSQEFDRLRKNIRECANLGVDYWLSKEPNTAKLGMAARIVGYQELINSYLLSLSKYLDNNRKTEFVDAQQTFFHSLSGDIFSEEDPIAIPERAFLIQSKMSSLIDEVRKCQVSTMMWWKLFAIAFKRH